MNMQEINPLKRINLQQYQKPKTLIVVHYKGKRISVPLLGDCQNLTQMLYHHIDKFQQAVIKSDAKWQVLSHKKIVCFCSSSNTNQKLNKQKNPVNRQTSPVKRNIQRYLRYSDGDLKIDILLSIIRIQQLSKGPSLDITKYYKYMQIEPYFIQYPSSFSVQPNNPLLHKYYLYRLTQKNRVKNVYLARSLQNGYFYSIKVYRSGFALAQHQVRLLNAVNCQKTSKIPEYMLNHYSEECNNLKTQDCIIPMTQIYMIPSQQQEDEDQDPMQQKYKHLAIISKYNLKGKLSDKIHERNSRITQSDLLKYLKQLVWIVYNLHEEHNIIHRNLTPESFQIDELGDLRLTTFSSWLQCYNQHGHLIQYPSQGSSGRSQFSNSSRIYEQQFQLASDGWYHIGHYTPPEVSKQSKQGYNKFVDYYTIGIVIRQIYQKIYQFHNKTENIASQKLIQKMVSSLTSQNLKQRDEIVLQIVQSIKKSKFQQTQRKNKQISLNLGQIKLGQLINIDISQSCVQNQDSDMNFNGISHQQIINFFKPMKQIKESIYSENVSQYDSKKQLSKEKKESSKLIRIPKGDLSNVSNSRDKSLKSIKSNKSKDKSRIKSKLLNDKGEKAQIKPKSKSHKKLVSPERNSFNNNSGTTSKLTRTYGNDNPAPLVPKKSKSRSCEKLKQEKSPDRKPKQKNEKALTYTNFNRNPDTQQTHKLIGRTRAQIPLPKQGFKSPTKNY